jgi:hypothetical protein
MGELSRLELELLLLYYTYSDQYGIVDMTRCQKWAKENMNIYISSQPFKITQDHVNALSENGILPDISDILSVAALPVVPCRDRKK